MCLGWWTVQSYDITCSKRRREKIKEKVTNSHENLYSQWVFPAGIISNKNKKMQSSIFVIGQALLGPWST